MEMLRMVCGKRSNTIKYVQNKVYSVRAANESNVISRSLLEDVRATPANKEPGKTWRRQNLGEEYEAQLKGYVMKMSDLYCGITMRHVAM